MLSEILSRHFSQGHDLAPLCCIPPLSLPNNMNWWCSYSLKTSPHEKTTYPKMFTFINRSHILLQESRKESSSSSKMTGGALSANGNTLVSMSHDDLRAVNVLTETVLSL